MFIWHSRARSTTYPNRNRKDQLLFILSSPQPFRRHRKTPSKQTSPPHTYDTIYPSLTLPPPSKKKYEAIWITEKKSKHDLCTADWYYYLVSPFHSLLLDNRNKTKILQWILMSFNFQRLGFLFRSSEKKILGRWRNCDISFMVFTNRKLQKTIHEKKKEHIIWKYRRSTIFQV